MSHSPVLKPISSVLWVAQEGIEVLKPEYVTIERVGEKAFGLSALPAKWTLPFFVISDQLFDDYIEKPVTKDNLIPILEKIFNK